MIPLNSIKHQREMANTLFIVALIQLLLGGLYAWFYWGSLEHSYWQAWIFIFSAPIYVILGFLARWIARYAVLIGFVLYLYLTFTVHALPQSAFGVWQDGLIFEFPILTFLLWRLLVGNDLGQPRRTFDLLLFSIVLMSLGFGVYYAIRKIAGLNEWISDIQGSLIGSASALAKQTRMVQIVDNFCEANSKLFRMSIVAGYVLGASSTGLFLTLVALIMRTKRDHRKKETSRQQNEPYGPAAARMG